MESKRKQPSQGWPNNVRSRTLDHDTLMIRGRPKNPVLQFFHVWSECPRIALIWLVETLSKPYWLHLCYFVGLSTVGFIPIWMLRTKSKRDLNALDAFYTCVSAVTVTSLGTVRMQEFSELQLVVMIILMFMGGEVFTSMSCLHIRRFKYHNRQRNKPEKKFEPTGCREVIMKTLVNPWALELATVSHNASNKSASTVLGRSSLKKSVSECDLHSWVGRQIKAELDWVFSVQAKSCSSQLINEGFVDGQPGLYNGAKAISGTMNHDEGLLVYKNALKYLGYIVLIYLFVVQLISIIVIIIYFYFSPEGEQILKTRGVKTFMFAVFTTVSSFANCGFIPLDDNMMPFRKNALILFIIAFQILLGNTMFAPCLRAIIWTLHRFSANGPRRGVYDYILRHPEKMYYSHLFPSSQSVWLMLTIVGFLTVQLITFCALHWKSEALDGLSSAQKLMVGGFQSVSTRHAGENVVIPGLLSPALIVLYIVLMYLPPYPVYIPDGYVKNIKPPSNTFVDSILFLQSKPSVSKADHEKIRVQLKKLLLHDSCYLVIAVILVCITERNSLSSDPLNYTVLSIVFEVVSAYGNVGLSLGYSCRLFMKLSNRHNCEDVAFSFSGKWSPKGKVLIIIVMFIGRLKGIEGSSDSNFKAKIKDFPSKARRWVASIKGAGNCFLMNNNKQRTNLFPAGIQQC
eukprot:Gb_33972 [translate_table: standard]